MTIRRGNDTSPRDLTDRTPKIPEVSDDTRRRARRAVALQIRRGLTIDEVPEILAMLGLLDPTEKP